MRRALLPALLALFIPLAAYAQAGTGCVVGHTQSLFNGNGNTDPALWLATVTLYGNAAARGDANLMMTLGKAKDIWNTDCPRAGSATRPKFPHIPSLHLNQTQTRTQAGANSRNGIQVNFVDARAPHTRHADGSYSMEPAVHGGANEITVYRQCPAEGAFPDYDCPGGGRGLIDWNSPMGITALAHEIGHALGLDHDRGSTPSGACPMSLMNRSPSVGENDPPLSAVPYCDAVNRILNDNHPCKNETAQPDEGTPCERPTPAPKPPGGISGGGSTFCQMYPWLCSGGSNGWSGGAPQCNWFCVSSLGTTWCEWSCFAPAVTAMAFGDVQADAEADDMLHAAPLLAIDAPAEGATVSGVVTVTGFAHEFFFMPSMTFGIDGQEIPAKSLRTGLFRDNVIWEPNRNRNPGFRAEIDTRRVPNGTHKLQIIATDKEGFPTRLERTITTNNSCFDMTPPTATIPLTSASGVVTIPVNAADDVAVKKVDFYIDTVYKGTDNSAPFTWTWDTSSYSPGSHLIEIQVHDTCANATYAAQYVTVQKPANAAQFVSQSGLPSTMTPGQSATVSITMRNTGSSAWKNSDGYKLGSSSPDNNTTWGTSRALLTATDNIAWNQTKTFTFTVYAPASPGTYTFKWRMVREMVEWFGDYTPTLTVTVQGGSVTPAGYQGCYTDQPTRALPYQLGGTNHTVESCKQAAYNAGLLYAGVQYYGYCFGGNSLGYTRVADSECSTPCTADSSQMCGGVWRNSIYATGYVAPTASILWIQRAEASWGTPGTLTAAGHARNGTGLVQLVFRERGDNGVWGPWTVVPYQAGTNSVNEWSNTISSGSPTNACHHFDAYVNYSGITSPIFHYTGAPGCM